jgi:hypothetical protein
MNNNQKENSSLSFKNKSDEQQIALDLRVLEILATLEIDAEIPDGLVEKVVNKKDSVFVKKPSKFDFSKYLQIAAVFAAAICVGVVMGKNADINSFHKKQNKENQALIELREKLHLSDINSFGRL